MKSFKVTYLDTAGKRLETLVHAKNADDARVDTQSMGQVLSVKRVSGGGFGHRRMSLNDRLIFMQRMASMLASRVGAGEALDVIQASFSGSVREAARIMKDQIANHGASFSEAMAAAGPKYFPDTTVAIVHTGSQGGDLSYAIREAARFERELADVRKESGKGLFSAVGGFIIGIITILATTLYVAPMILDSGFIEAGDGANDMGWMISLNDWLTYIAIGASGLIFLIIIINVFLRPIAPVLIDKLVLKVPYYRDMVLAKSNYMVFFGLAILLKAGLRVEQAFSLTIDSAPRGELRADLERARKAIVAGRGQEWPYVMKMLHPTDRAALATAQDKEQIAITISDLALQYRALYRARLEALVPMLQVFSALFLSVAGFVLFAISTIPLLQSSSNILEAF